MSRFPVVETEILYPGMRLKVTPQLVAYQCFLGLVNQSAPDEFLHGSGIPATIVGRTYAFDEISREHIGDFCERVGQELMADMRGSGLKKCVVLPLIEDIFSCELVSDRESHLSMRMAIEDKEPNAPLLIRFEVGLNP